MAFMPDPLSLWWELSAQRALDVAYGHPGRYYGTIIADPSPRQREVAARLITSRVDGPDTHTGRKARTRWCRAFVRALERQNKRNGGRPIEWDVGVRVAGGRAFRVRTVPAGRLRRPLDKPDRQRIYDKDGNPAGRWADNDLRDWDFNGEGLRPTG